MSRFRRSRIALPALAVLFAGAGMAAAPPSPPRIPLVGSIPGAQTARFRVVVEGDATAAEDFAGGSTAPCVVQLQGRVSETTTYRRGTGVVMEFTRVGAVVLVHRAGRLTDASLNLKVRTTRTASGSTSRADVPRAPVSICPALSEDLSQGAECGRPQVVNMRAALLYERGHLRARLNGADGPAFTPPDCPTSQIVDGLDSLRLGWPTPPAAEQMTFLITPGGHLRQRDGEAAEGHRPHLPGDPLAPEEGSRDRPARGRRHLTLTDFGTSRLTIRLIGCAERAPGGG